MAERLIINAHGDIKEIHTSFYEQATNVLQKTQQLVETPEKRRKEANLYPKADYPKLPIAILMATDIHYGSLKTNYSLLNEHLKIVNETPNFYMITNGDLVDNFNVTGKWAQAVYENPLAPQLQTKAMIEKYAEMSRAGKYLLMSFGNHEDFMTNSGYDWYDSYAASLKIPVFQSGGLAKLHVGSQEYKIAITHQHWGTSKLNPTNACKRFWEHEYPEADISFLGHTHQSEMLTWERAGREMIGLIGGTYKLDDVYARKHGIGGRGGQPGHTILFFPDEHKMLGFKHIADAKKVMDMLMEQQRR